MKKVTRINKIRKKFGVSAFQKWGKMGGSPILIAAREGRVSIRRKK